MEQTAESAVLFSALQLAESLSIEGLNNSKLEQSVLNKCNNAIQTSDIIHVKTIDDGQNTDKILLIICDAIAEIVHGLEYDFSVFEQNHWKYEIASVLILLALKDDLNVSSQNNLESLECYPGISMDLLVEIVTRCELETAVLEVLQDLPDAVVCRILCDICHCLNTALKTQISLEEYNKQYGLIIDSIVAYCFIHSKSVLFKSNSDTDCKRKIIAGIVQVIGCLMNRLVENIENNSKHDLLGKYIVTIIVGFVNFLNGININTFYCVDILEFKNIENSLFIRQEKKCQFSVQKVASDYTEMVSVCQFQHLNKDMLIYYLLEEKYQDKVHFRESVFSRTENDFAKQKIIEIMNRLNSRQVVGYVDSLLNYSKNVMKIIVHDENWVQSFICRIILKKIKEGIDFKKDYGTEFIDTVDGDQCGDLLVMKVINESMKSYDLSEEELFEKHLFFVNEKLNDYRQDIKWLLEYYQTKNFTKFSKWLICMENCIEELRDTDLSKDLLKSIFTLKNSENIEHESLTSLKYLFLKVFHGMQPNYQNYLMKIVFKNIKEPKDFFEVDEKQILGDMTSQLNRFTGEEISQDLLQETAKLFLMDPGTCLKEIVTCVLQNSKMASVVVDIINCFDAVWLYKPVAAMPTMSYIMYCVLEISNSAETLLEKQVQNMLLFLKILCKECANFQKVDFLVDCIIPQLTSSSLDWNQTWKFVMKILNVILQNCNFALQKKECNFVVLLSILVQQLAYIEQCKSMESDYLIYSMNRSLLIEGIEHVQNLVIKCWADSSLKSEQIKDIQWTYQIIAGLKSNHLMSFLVPLLNQIKNDKQLLMKAGIQVKVPADMTMYFQVDLLPFPCVHCPVLYNDKPTKVFLLQFASADILCNSELTKCVKDKISEDFDYCQWLAALVLVLPRLLPVEWIRIFDLLTTIAKNSQIVHRKTESALDNAFNRMPPQFQAELTIQRLYFNALMVLYDGVSRMEDSLEAVLIQGFVSVFTTRMMSLMTSQDSFPEGLITVAEEHVDSICDLICLVNMESHRNQVIGLGLEVLERYKRLKQCKIMEDFQNVIESVHKLPVDVKSLFYKSLQQPVA